MCILERIVVLALVCAAGAWTSAAGAALKAPVREVLPDSVIPLHYDLALAPDAEALTFRAKVAITLDVHAGTSAITLNAVGLSFDHATVDGGNEATVSTDEKLGRATLELVGPCHRSGRTNISTARCYPRSTDGLRRARYRVQRQPQPRRRRSPPVAERPVGKPPKASLPY
jgi:aminopeptidase N